MAERRGSDTSRRGPATVPCLVAFALAVVAAACGSSAATSGPETTASGSGSGRVVTVEPSTDVVGGQKVLVNGTGFPAAVGIGIGQCAAGGRDMSTCDTSTAAQVMSDAGGSFTVDFEVRSSIGVESGLVDCAVSGACEVLVGVPTDPTTLVAVPLQVAAGPPRFSDPSCPGPYSPVGYAQDAFGEPLPPNVSGDQSSAEAAGASVSVQRVGEALLITVAYGGVERELTTAPDRVGSNYDRSSDPMQNLYGKFSIVTGAEGRTYVVLTQGNSGEYTQFGWRFDDPCAGS